MLTLAQVNRIAALSASMTLLGSAQAQEATAGVYLSLVFEQRAPSDWGLALGWGVELTGNMVIDKGEDFCGPVPQLSALGLSGRLGFVGWGDGRLSAGLLYSRRETPQSTILAAEAALLVPLSGAWGDGNTKSSIVPALALRADFDPGEAIARWTFGLNEGELGIGVATGPRLGVTDSGCVVGRPMRDAAGEQAAGPQHHMNASSAVIARWLQMAEMERDSVPAFLQLARDLAALDAPADLIDQALTAAEDELRHVRLCLKMVVHLGGDPTRMAPVQASPRPSLTGHAGWVRLAVESWADGCLGEGSAAAQAAVAARLAEDPMARQVQTRIAHDETRHAALGWQVLTWAARVGGTPVLDALETVRIASMRADEFVPVAPQDARWGVLDAPRNAAIRQHTWRQAQVRLNRMLARAVAA